MPRAAVAHAMSHLSPSPSLSPPPLSVHSSDESPPLSPAHSGGGLDDGEGDGNGNGNGNRDDMAADSRAHARRATSAALRIHSDHASGAMIRKRRQRDVRAARDRLSDQFDQLRRVLPALPDGGELQPKALVLEHSVRLIHTLMQRATFLAMELAVVSPDATRRWVRVCAGDGRRPLLHTVAAVMKLFAARTRWRYGEWWTLDECEIAPVTQHTTQSNGGGGGGAARSARDDGARARGGRGGGGGRRKKESVAHGADNGAEDAEDDGEVESVKPAGVMDDPGNVHGCVVRDTASVMKLAWTLVQRQSGFADGASDEGSQSDEETKLTQFARASEKFEFRPRVGMPGRVWTSRRAEWLMELRDRETFRRSPLAEEFGMQTCLAVPVQFGGHVHSVMSFYSRQQRAYDPEVYDLACVMSKSIEEVYAPSSATPWRMGGDELFSAAQRR